MEIRPIATDAEHRVALQEIEALWGSIEGTPEGRRLDALVARVAAYEERRWAMERLIKLGGSDPDATAGRRRRSE